MVGRFRENKSNCSQNSLLHLQVQQPKHSWLSFVVLENVWIQKYLCDRLDCLLASSLTNSNRGITSSDMSDMLNNDMDVIIILASAIVKRSSKTSWRVEVRLVKQRLKKDSWINIQAGLTYNRHPTFRKTWSSAVGGAPL